MFSDDYRDQLLDEPSGDGSPRIHRCEICRQWYRPDESEAVMPGRFCSTYCETEHAKEMLERVR